MKKSVIFVAVLFLFITVFMSGYAFGYYGNSNLLGSYPSFSKSKPYKPFDKSDWNIRKYRQDVEDYVSSAKKYIEAAKNDIGQINDNIEDAIDEADEVIEDYNRWLKGW